MVLFKERKQSLKAAGGFTLIELLVVISILGVLAAVVILNVTRYMTAGRDEAKAVELKHVATAAGCYLVDGNHIASATTVGPGNPGIVAGYLTGNLKYYWSIDSDGSVSELFFANALNSLDGFTSVSGGWTSSGGVLNSAGSQDPGILMATGGNWSDFTLQTTATLSSGNGYGMYYLSDSNANTGYIVQFNPVSGFTVSTVADGTVLAQAPVPGGFAVNGQHNISVSVSGGTHTINVDGHTVITLTDRPPGSGTVGLQSSAGSNVNFTGFTVSPP